LEGAAYEADIMARVGAGGRRNGGGGGVERAFPGVVGDDVFVVVVCVLGLADDMHCLEFEQGEGTSGCSAGKVSIGEAGHGVQMIAGAIRVITRAQVVFTK
jgi:hypothetical protein